MALKRSVLPGTDENLGNTLAINSNDFMEQRPSFALKLEELEYYQQVL